MFKQIVPYIPIHPAQLTTDSVTNAKEETTDQDEPSPTVVSPESNFDDNIFKIPSVPTPYTVEEPCDNVNKRNSTMKR